MTESFAAIRPAVLADAAELARLHVACWQETYPGLMPDAVITSRSVGQRLALWSRILGEAAEG